PFPTRRSSDLALLRGQGERLVALLLERPGQSTQVSPRLQVQLGRREGLRDDRDAQGFHGPPRARPFVPAEVAERFGRGPSTIAWISSRSRDGLARGGEFKICHGPIV